MKNASNVVGIGCFAESNTLQRVFKKVLENFILSKYEDIGPAPECTLNDDNVTQFFRSVISSGLEKPDQIDRALESIPTSLVLFFLGRGHQQTKFIAHLEKFSRLRNTHLH
jgi:hypothetical protein